MPYFRALRIVPAALLAAATLAACDGGSSPGGAQPLVVQLATRQVDLAPGEQAHLIATVVGQSDSKVTDWRSSDPAIATVDPTGTVTGVSEGEANVIAAFGAAQSFAKVQVKKRAVSRIVVNPDAVTLRWIGAGATLTATAYDAGGAILTSAPAWSSTDTTVAKVSAAGQVTARGTGLARVVAAIGSQRDTAMIQVMQVVAAVALSPAAASLQTGQTATLQAVARDSGGAVVPATGFTWASSSPSVLTVDAAGMVRGVAPGTATVRATAGSGATAQAQVTVQAVPIATLAVQPASFALAPGQNAQASAIAKDAAGNVLTGRVVTWSSSNPAVANVSPVGVVFALADGTATITATSEGKTASVTATVKTVGSGGGTPTVFASSDFESGTLGPFTYPWTQAPNDLVVASDPTGSGRGKLVSIHYTRTSLSQGYDNNRGIMYEKSDGVGLGKTIVFAGDLYLDTPLAGSQPAQRKLLYWQPDGGGFPGFWSVLGLYGYSMFVNAGYITADESGLFQRSGFATLQPNRWYHIEMQVTLNTSFTSGDGIIRVWLDGSLVFEKTDMRFSDPTWTAPPANQKFRYFIVGDQMNYDGLYDEYRYWDNVTFTSSRVPR